MFDKEKFLSEINSQGYSIVPDVLSTDFLARIKNELERAIEIEAENQKKYETYREYGIVLFCGLYGGAFLELLDNRKLIEPLNAILGEGCIVYTYSSSSMPPGQGNYTHRVHVDCPRLIPNYITNVGAFVALDDTTEENGATWFLPNSHLLAEQPEEDHFYKHAKRFVAKAGSVLFFNARIWHAGGKNQTDRWRHGLAINMCRPYMKQRLDFPRMMSGMDLSGVPETVLQKLGFHAQVPASYDEFYAPPELRKFKQKPE